jgi:adenine phosphoribosyltransferase
MDLNDLNNIVRNIPDFPKPGIQFKDITPLLSNSEAFNYIINSLYEKHKKSQIDKVIGIESRGFIFGTPLAYKLECGFVPIRKPGKLPFQTISADYTLEYGTNTIEMHIDSIEDGENVLIIDDLLATGGTAEAAVRLVKRLGGKVVGLDFVIELEFLNGRDKLKGYEVFSFLKY